LKTYGIYVKYSATRMSAASLIRELFMRTEDYIDKKERGEIFVEAGINMMKLLIPTIHNSRNYCIS